MKKPKKLTDADIRKLKVEPGKPDAFIFDPSEPGFGARKYASGRVTLFAQLHAIGDSPQQRRVHLGPYIKGTLDAIRAEAAVVLAQAKLGKDVVGEAKKAAEAAKQAAEQAAQVKTLGDLVPVYLAVRQKGDDWKKLRPKTLGEVTRYLTKSWAPLHGEPIDKITRQMVKARRDEIKAEHPPTANLAMAALGTFFKWAIEAEHCSGDNPTTDIRRLQQNKRKRRLANDEIADIWACLDAHADEFGDFGPIIKLLFLTG